MTIFINDKVFLVCELCDFGGFVTFLRRFRMFRCIKILFSGKNTVKYDKLEYINCNKCDLPQLKFKRRRSSILDFFIYDFNPFGKG